jgi:hypothetical protein
MYLYQFNFYIPIGLGVVVFNTTFNNISVISWESVLLVEETRILVVGFITTNVPVQSLPKIPKVVSSNPAHDGEVHMIQHYVIKFVSDL